MRLKKLLGAIATASALLASAAAQSPVGNAITYQGRLLQNGAPADGVFDLWLRLYDSVTGGNSVGPAALIFDNVNVTDGLFTIAPDFGAAAFEGQQRWLQILVRPGEGNGSYMPLTPRQPLTATPYALHALHSDQWQSVGTSVINANAGFVGINRSAPTTSAEFFGIHAPVESGYGGMYVSTAGLTAKPFYGYTTGAHTAFSYLDGTSGDWNLYNGGNRVTVTDAGNVGIGTSNPIGKLHVPGNSGTQNTLYVENAGSAAAAAISAGSDASAAINILRGGLKVTGAGVNTPTCAFIYSIGAGDLTPNLRYARISHPLLDGNPNALVFVMPRGTWTGTAHWGEIGVRVVYGVPEFGGDHWAIHSPEVLMEIDERYNILAITP